jgi:hypothetical protein
MTERFDHTAQMERSRRTIEQVIPRDPYMMLAELDAINTAVALLRDGMPPNAHRAPTANV